MFDFLSTSFILKFLKFAAVGFSGLLVDYAFTYLFKEIFKIQKYVANSIGFTIAASTNYILNRVWTFESDNPDIALEYTEFLAISIVGLGINNLILWLIVSKFKINFYVAKFFAICVVTLWNFLANFFITFNQG
ncbi:MAG: GtrA family protein [Bacteroidales bacterium]|nr:GtrA family protein [Bacteroidales bacterium]MCK5339187.1 GtrA family protein [Bacteroidales bacterium]MCK5765808.1 GtrA family protein [Bacteroidales bacterium]